MVRITILCLLLAGAIAGRAHLKSPSLARGYCSTGSNRSCPEVDGEGDCQPCPVSAVKDNGKIPSSYTLAQRLP